MVVMAAEQDRVGEVGVATPTPRMQVMRLRPRSRHVAPLGATSFVAYGERSALGRVEQSLRAAHVEDLGLPSEHHGYEVGGTGQATSVPRGEAAAGPCGGDAQTGGIWQLAHGVGASRRAVGALRVGPRVEVGREPVSRRVRDADPDRGGAVAVRLGAQARLPPSVPLLVLELLALVLLLHLRRDDPEDATAEPPELLGREVGGVGDQGGLCQRRSPARTRGRGVRWSWAVTPIGARDSDAPVQRWKRWVPEASSGCARSDTREPGTTLEAYVPPDASRLFIASSKARPAACHGPDGPPGSASPSS